MKSGIKQRLERLDVGNYTQVFVENEVNLRDLTNPTVAASHRPWLAALVLLAT